MKELLKKWFALKPKTVEAQAPYKVETPVTPVADDVTRAMLESIPAPVPAKGPKVKKAPAAKKAPAVKKPRAPRKPKAK